jgi:tetratricopeptide (TPR) repeat protein
MTTITLQEYQERIEKLIDENMLTDAESHCRHILESHPGNITTYRLLAKALLEKHEYDGAADLFQRVLSADPNDFVAHVGLAIIRAEETQLEDALWHLQRAFEIEPYNAAIQEELRRHYVQFSDMAVDRIPLTAGALARLYIKGELYQQAVQELRQAIQHGQDRVDLEVLLAEALWRNDQRVDAEEVCLNVLQKLPNCIAANAILSEIWLQTGRIGESQKYLRRLLNLTSLDKATMNVDTAVGRAFRAEGAPPLPEVVELPFKEDGQVAAVPGSVAGKGPSADWMNEVTFDSEPAGVVAESPSGMHSYDWMAEVNDDLSEDESLPVESEWFMDESLKVEPSLEDDWLVEMGAAADTAVANNDFDLLFAEDEGVSLEPETTAGAEDEDWFLAQSESELQAEETFASEQSVPAWLIPLVNEPDLSDVEEEAVESNVGSDWFGESHEAEPLPMAETNMPDWLSNLVDEGPSVPAAFAEVDLGQPAAAVNDQNEWMIDEHAEDHWDEADYNEESVPDWLLKQTGELEESLAGAAGGDQADIDDWLAGAAADVPAAGPEEESRLTGWLSDEVAEAPKGAAALGLTAMFASLDDMPEAETAAIAGEDDDLDVLFAGVSDSIGGSAPPAADYAEIGEDDWLSALEPESEGDWAVEEDTAVSLDDWHLAMEDGPAAAEEKISLNSDWLTLGDDIWADDVTVETTGPAVEDSPSFGEQSYLEEDLVEEEEVIPDWLLGNDQAVVGEAEDMAMGDEDEEEAALPEWSESEDDFVNLGGDWLSAFTTNEEEELLPDDHALDVTPVMEELPDWLSGFESDEVAETEAEWAEEVELDEAMVDEEPIPGWLTGLAAAAVTDEPPTVASPAAEETDDELFDVLADMSAAESPLADWLADDDFEPHQEMPIDKRMADTAVPSGGLTAWLQSLPEGAAAEMSEPEPAEMSVDVPEIPSEELFATDSDNLPDWLSPGSKAALSAADDDSNLPDWLMGSMGDVPDPLDSDQLFATDEAVDLTVLDDLADLEQLTEVDTFADALDLADETEFMDEEEAGDELTAVGLTALLSGIHDEPATLSGLAEDTDIDWLAAMDEGTGSAMDAAEEMELNWLAEDITADIDEMETAAPAMPEPDLLEMEQDAPSAEMDDAISWLEELASQQETPVDELPTVAQTLLAEEVTGLGIHDQPAFVAGEEDFDLGFDEVLDEAFAEAFPAEMMEIVDEPVRMAEEEEAGASWLDVLMAEEEDETAATLSAPPEDDPEAAIAWLEGLAANQGAPLEELPTLQGRTQRDLDGLVGEAQADLDEALAWMDDLAAEPETKEEWPELDEELLATMIGGAAVTSATKPAASPAKDELAEALDFLEEQLIAEGITAPVSAGTAVVPDSELLAALDWLEESIAAEPAAPLAAAVSESEDLFDEPAAIDMPDLTGLADEDTWEDEDWDWEQSESITDLLNVVAKPATGKMVEAEEEEQALLDMPDDPDAAMEWLSRFATTGDEGEESETALAFLESEAWDDTEIEEGMEQDETWDEPAGLMAATAVTDRHLQVQMDDLDISDMPEDPDEAMNWLMSMAQGDTDIDFDMQPPPITPSEDARFAIEYDVPAPAVMSEPVVEMETAVDDFPTLAADMEDEAEWLEDMLADDFEIDFDMQPPPITPSEDAKFAIEYDVPAPAVTPEPVVEVETAVDDFPTLAADLEDEAEWLEDMLADDFEIDFDMQPPPITPSEDAKFAIEYDTPTTQIVEPALTLDEIEETMPDDPDEAMDWLQKLTDTQTGSLESAAPPDDAPLPAWLSQGEVEEDEELPGLLTEAPIEEDLDLIENLGVDMEDDLSDSLPDWLAADGGRSSGSGQTGWLTAVEDIDVISWLAAEEEATTVDFDEIIMPEHGEARPVASSARPASDRLPSLTLAEPDMPAESFEVQPIAAKSIDTVQLSDVRVALAEKKYEEAATHYQQLIASGTATLGLIAELESLADEFPTQPAFRRLLGDAYMRNGQLQKALNSYRTALDQL